MKDQHPAEIKPAERQRDDEVRPGQEEKEDEEEEEEEEDDDEEEEECSVSVEAELACMEEKWREQCTVNENLKLLLANEEKRFQVCKHTHTHTHRGSYMIQVPLIPQRRASHRYIHSFA